MQSIIIMSFFTVVCFSVRVERDVAAVAFAIMYLGISQVMSENAYNETLNKTE